VYFYLYRKGCRANKGAIERGFAPLLPRLSLPFNKGKREKRRIRLTNIL
jgi:hypothetical protein